MNELDSMAALPVWRPSEPLTHIGTLDEHAKGWSSLEGHGLSVSTCPQAWQRIARLGGNPWWLLERTDGHSGAFLDAHAMAPAQRADVMAWAARAGHVTPASIHELHRFDTEAMSWQISSSLSEEAARTEHRLLSEEFDDEPQFAPKLITTSGWVMTEQGLAATRRRRADPGEAIDLATVLWTEHSTDLDGVFWNDVFDPTSLSAPRAVVLPGRLGHWQALPDPQCPTAQSRRGRRERSTP